MRGLNGEIIYQREDVRVGRTDGEAYGYKRPLWVTVSVSVEANDRQDAYETVNHDMVSRPLAFSITTGVWRPDGRDIVSGGATVEPLRELATFVHGFDAGKAEALAELDYWHLNALRAGCAHQEHSDDPCPETGYKYGHAWLVEELPDGFVQYLSELLPPE
jgi:hypothetical protein